MQTAQQIDIRPASASDLPLMAELVAAFYTEEHIPYLPDTLLPTLRAILDRPEEGAFYLLMGGEAVIGFACLTFPLSLEAGGRRAYLEDFYIDPAHRNGGAGSRAIALIEAAVRDRGCPWIALECVETNEKAQRFYQRHQYQAIDRRLYWRIF